MQLKRSILTESIFFYFFILFVLFTLGYSFFNNTANHLESDSDSVFYLFMAEHGYPPEASDHRAGRILIPKLTSILFNHLDGMLGSWDSLKFSFFVVNATFILISVIFYHMTMHRLGYTQSLIRISGLIFIVSFATTNYYIRGSVDPGEILFLAGLTWSLVANRLIFLPIIFILGVTNRETFLAVGAGLFMADLLYDFLSKEKNRKQFFAKFIMLIISVSAGALTHVLVQYYVSGEVNTPINSLQEFNGLPEWGEERSYFDEIRRFLYVFIVPITAILLSKLKLPRRILLHIAGLFATVMLGSWLASTSGTGLSRYLFAGTGFYFSMCIASLCLGRYEK